jgi:hypothetical protein
MKNWLITYSHGLPDGKTYYGCATYEGCSFDEAKSQFWGEHREWLRIVRIEILGVGR